VNQDKKGIGSSDDVVRREVKRSKAKRKDEVREVRKDKRYGVG
jgi:hypothetical protein